MSSEHTGGAWPVAIAFELAISTGLTVEDFSGALSQGSLVLRRNGGLA